MRNPGKMVRYAVVGLGYISQARSAADRKPVKLDNTPPRKRPSRVQEISRPPVRKPELVAAEGPSPD